MLSCYGVYRKVAGGPGTELSGGVRRQGFLKPTLFCIKL